jgi:hypothetical protein
MQRDGERLPAIGLLGGWFQEGLAPAGIDASECGPSCLIFPLEQGGKFMPGFTSF